MEETSYINTVKIRVINLLFNERYRVGLLSTFRKKRGTLFIYPFEYNSPEMNLP